MTIFYKKQCSVKEYNCVPVWCGPCWRGSPRGAPPPARSWSLSERDLKFFHLMWSSRCFFRSGIFLGRSSHLWHCSGRSSHFYEGHHWTLRSRSEPKFFSWSWSWSRFKIWSGAGTDIFGSAPTPFLASEKWNEFKIFNFFFLRFLGQNLGLLKLFY